jgi:hypothetical protein
MNRHLWLGWAEIFDSWRVVPRLALAGYGLFVYKTIFYILDWYTHEPATSRGTEESAVVGVVVTALTGFAPWIFRIYSENGRDWQSSPPPQQPKEYQDVDPRPDRDPVNPDIIPGRPSQGAGS